MAVTPNFRRYKRGEIPEYDKQYNFFMTKSAILNRGNNATDFRNAFILQSLREVDAEIKFHKNLIENKDPQTIRGRLEFTKSKIKEHERKCKETGIPLSINPVSSDLLQDKFRYESQIDVKKLEIQKLETMREGFMQVETQERNENMLKMGPIGMRWGEDPLREVDGQAVGFVDEENVIIEETSPYRGLSVLDYFERIVTPWIKGETKPNVYKKYPMRIVAPDDLPKWPDGCVNHFKKKEKEKEKLQRTK